MKTAKYQGFWSVNNGSTWGKLEGNNAMQLKKDLRAIAQGNCPAGSKGFWSISKTEDPEWEIASGYVRN